MIHFVTIMDVVCLLFLGLLANVQGALRLASYYADHMVLQRGPQKAVLWGFADTEASTVTATISGHGSATGTVHNRQWKLALPAITDPGPFVIEVRSPDGHVTLHDVLFGDVWLCSGQSNMEFSMRQLINGSAEVSAGVTHSTIRYMKTAWTTSHTPVIDLQVGEQWTLPIQASLQEFSAVCFLFGVYLQSHLNYPIGLLGAYFGGTSIETWSPPEALSSCPHTQNQEPSSWWNSKIYALRSFTIKGATWYQGEANWDHPTEYVCQEKAMIREWRKQFNAESMGQTSANFPFGIVQLAPYEENNDYPGAYPALRWAQTADHGFVPNADLPNTFMAVAMDLPDYHSPGGAIHPRYKHDVASRLVKGALNLAYGQGNVAFQGPFPTSFQQSGHEVTITFDQGHAHLDIRTNKGFEVCCNNFGPRCDASSSVVAAPIIRHDQSTVTIDTSGCQNHQVTAVRYAWRTSPCPLLQCAVYDNTGLPAPCFFLDINSVKPMVG